MLALLTGKTSRGGQGGQRATTLPTILVASSQKLISYLSFGKA